MKGFRPNYIGREFHLRPEVYEVLKDQFSSPTVVVAKQIETIKSSLFEDAKGNRFGPRDLVEFLPRKI